MMRAAPTPARGRRAAPAVLSAPRRYRVTDARSGEEIDLPAARLEVILGIEIGYIDWCLACDGAFANGRWRVTVPP